MIEQNHGLTQVEYIVLAAIVLGVVGVAAWQLQKAIAQKLDEFRNSL